MGSKAANAGFMVFHSNRLEDLRDLLLQVVKSRPLPVFSPEVILVQNNGMKHWLEIALSADRALGICAATQIELPGRYLWSIYRAVLAGQNLPTSMPFDKKSLVWRLYKLLPGLLEDSDFQPLKKYLGIPVDTRRLYQLSHQIADVFDGYQYYRADWLEDWAHGEFRLLGDTKLRKPEMARLGESDLWQPKLWQALRSDVGEHLAEMSRASVHSQFLRQIDKIVEDYKSTGQIPKDLPLRVFVFGISSLPPQIIEALARLGQICQVFMFVQNPCQHYWGNIVDGYEMLKQWSRSRHSMRIGDQHFTSHPLLASWGKQGRDYFHLLQEFDDVETYKKNFDKVDVFEDPAPQEVKLATQLNLVQSSILNILTVEEDKQRFQDILDDTIKFVSTHSTQRELEVLHDQLHAWFAEDPHLRPNEVMVMVPEMESFLPSIKAVFGRFSSHDKSTISRFIPYSIADTTPKESSLVRALTQLLCIPSSKISVMVWLDLFEVDAISNKFQLDTKDIEQIKEWLIGSGVRWGLDAEHRVQHGLSQELEDLDQNTWEFGLRRLLLGYALDRNQIWQETLAYPGVRGLSSTLMSKLIDWIDAIKSLNAILKNDHKPEEWVEIFKSILNNFFKACDEAQERLLNKIYEPLEHWLNICKDCSLDQRIPLQVVSEYWLKQLEELGSQQRFIGGGVQFGTLMPMRSIPFKIICLLGMNDGAFPRQSSSRDFDLMAHHWRTGDRSRREDDRYLFLEALICARKRLYISWQGNDAKDNTQKPCAVPVAQLMDYLEIVTSREVQVIQYPLQPFSRKYFEIQSPFTTYDADWANGFNQARNLIEGDNKNDRKKIKSTNTVFARLGFQELYRLLRHPVEVYFRSRLKINFDHFESEVLQEEPFGLNHLESFKIKDEILKSEDTAQSLKIIDLSGRLPLQEQGKKLSKELESEVLLVKKYLLPFYEKYPKQCMPLNLSVKVDETLVEATLEDLRCEELGKDNELQFFNIQARIANLKISNLKLIKGYVVIDLWLNHLIAGACGYRLKSVLVGIDAQVMFEPLDKDKACEILRNLIKLYSQAWNAPIPLAAKTAWIWLMEYQKNQLKTGEEIDFDAIDDKAEEEFEPTNVRKDGPRGERKESLYLQRAFNTYEDIKEGLAEFSKPFYADMAQEMQITFFKGEGE